MVRCQTSNYLDYWLVKGSSPLHARLYIESSEIAQVEDAMGSLTERWLFVEEMLKQKRDQLSDTARQKCEDDIDAVLNNKTSLSMEDKDNQDRLTRLKVSLALRWLSLNDFVKRFFFFTTRLYYKVPPNAPTSSHHKTFQSNL